MFFIHDKLANISDHGSSAQFMGMQNGLVSQLKIFAWFSSIARGRRVIRSIGLIAFTPQ